MVLQDGVRNFRRIIAEIRPSHDDARCEASASISRPIELNFLRAALEISRWKKPASAVGAVMRPSAQVCAMSKNALIFRRWQLYD